MTTPSISVALATYNGQQYLREQLDSVYSQTLPPFEVVVTDDASTDQTVEILKGYERSHGLRYERNPTRLGLVKNFERVISLCRGDLIALCDQDDVWKRNKLATLAARIGSHTLAYCNVQEYISPTGSIQRADEVKTIISFARRHGSGRCVRQLLTENWVVGHSTIFKRSLVQYALPIPAGQAYHDAWLALVAASLDGIVFVDECLQTYRRHQTSYTYARKLPARLPWTRFEPSRYRRTWRAICSAQRTRLADALGLETLTADEKRFCDLLLRYYEAGLPSARGWRAATAGLRLGQHFSSLHARGGRLRAASRALLGT